MKRSIFLSIILSLFLVACIPQAMAQKQSRLEKLLRYLNDNDADKWQKNRDKIDDETQTYYAEELALLDVLNGLWNEQSEQAATNYFGCYERATKAYFPNICEEEKIQLSNVQNKAELAVISILDASKDQIPFSKTLMDSIQSSGYPGDSAILCISSFFFTDAPVLLEASRSSFARRSSIVLSPLLREKVVIQRSANACLLSGLTSIGT